MSKTKAIKWGAQVNAKGDKPASSPELDAEIRRRKTARLGPPTEADAPPHKPFPGRPPHVHEGQLDIL